MTNQEVAKLLRNVAAVYLLTGENRFKIIAYEKAADSIQNSPVEIQDLWREGKLSSLSGLGPAINSHLDELFRKGEVKHFKRVLKRVSESIFPLLDIPGFGPKKASKLVSELKLKEAKTVVDSLLKAAKQGRIAVVEGFGTKSQEDIIEAIKRFKKGQIKENRILLSSAWNTADEVIQYLKEFKGVLDVQPLGSLRRKVATIGDIDIAVATNDPEGVINWFVKNPKVNKIIDQGQSGATVILENGRQIDLRVQIPERFGTMLQYFTGSKNHNIRLRELALKKGLSLSEYGIKPIDNSQKSRPKADRPQDEKLKIHEYAREKELYQALGLSWIPPELREDSGEIEAALLRQPADQGKLPGLPKLVELKDIKGDLHLHTSYNLEPSHDLGTSPLEDILNLATDLGYEYIGLSDHNPSYSNHSESQIVNILMQRRQKYEQILESTKSTRVNLFIMLEVDILPDGQLPIPDKAFSYLDAIIVSIHSSFHLDREAMTKRVIKGLYHPKAKILAHPSGRLLGQRQGYEVEWSKLFNFCRTNNKAIEINAHPVRLDLPDILVRQAIEAKVKLIINTDSHKATDMNLMPYGVYVAQRGWSTNNDILNTLPYNKIKEWLFN